MDELLETGIRSTDRLVEKLQKLKSEKKITREEHHELINDLTSIKTSLQLLQMIMKEEI